MDLPLPAPPGDPARQRLQDTRRFRRAALLSAGFVAVLWWVHLLQQWFGPLSGLRLHPGEAAGLVGILTAPLLHASVAHLVANSLPLLVLGTLVLAVYPRAGARAIPAIWLLSGLGVWLLGRPPAHLGASGLSHGLLFLLLGLGLLRRDRAAIAAGMIAFFLYGGMLMTIFPREAGISWEYHLSGALAGALCALWLRRHDPPLPRKRYDWEDEEAVAEEAEDPLEPPRPPEVPVLWQRPAPPEERGQVLPFRRPGEDAGGNE